MSPRRWWGAWALLVLVFSACATSHPAGQPPPAPEASRPPASDVGLEEVAYEVEVLEPGHGATRPVPVSQADFQRAIQRIAREVQHEGKSPREAAHEWLKEQVEHPPEWEQLSGTWVAEVYKGRVLSLVPVHEDDPLTPEADAALRDKYLAWCTRAWGGGDCLRLLDDAPYLKADDRRTLALALAFGSVLEETKAALGRELDPQVLVASCMWTLGTYLALWLVPEPTTKLLAAGLSVVLVAWLGVDTLWGLMDGWALPRGKSIHDIPAEDEVGDLLQKVVLEAAQQWGHHRLTRNETKAIDEARKKGEYWLAHLLEREARGRFVHVQVKKKFEGLFQFNHQGIDVIDPRNNRQYEILSGTASNLAHHGRRMAGEFFRMISF